MTFDSVEEVRKKAESDRVAAEKTGHHARQPEKIQRQKQQLARFIAVRGGIVAVGMAFGTAAHAEAPQLVLDQLADSIGYRYDVVDNSPSCPPAIDNCHLSTITLTVPKTLPDALPPKGLSLYFSFAYKLLQVESDIFDYQPVNGDVQKLVLKPGEKLVPGATYKIKLWGLKSNFSKAFAMPNAYFVADGVRPRTIAATRPVIDPDTGLDVTTFVAPMTDEARLATKNDGDKTRWLTAERAFALQAQRQAPKATGVAILPKPAKATIGKGGRVDLRGGVSLTLGGVQREAVEPALAALARAGVAEDGKLPLIIRVDASKLASEAYELDVSRRGVTITAHDAAGAGYALRSLAQQAAFDKGLLIPLRIKDAPQYGFRGLHIDLARNFHSRDEILKLIETMASYKLNKLQLHLADDEGWRIEVPALPELTEIGSKRCHDPSEQSCLLPTLGAGPDGTSSVNGYLSTADYVAIVRAAAARQIEVIPAIDMPGHSRAAVKAMEVRYGRLAAQGKNAEAEQYRLIDPADTTVYHSVQNYSDNTLNVCLPSTYRFIDTVVDAVAELHREAGAPLKTFHLGADETAGAWVKSPACAAMIAENGGDAKKLTPRFIERIANSLAAKGLRAGGWSDGLGHAATANMPEQVQSNIWGGLHNSAVRETHDQLNRGWDVVLSIPDFAYFDMPYAPHPDEGGLDWASRGVDTYRIFGFMPENLPANAALVRDVRGQEKPVDDIPVLQSGRRIAGIQAQIWSEMVRTDMRLEYMLFPRLLAIAERAWRPAVWQPAYQPGASYKWHDPRIDRAKLNIEWRDFSGRVAAQFPQLEKMGIAYRVAPPGARIVNGKLEANSDFPGATIEYRVGNAAWKRYDKPVAVKDAVELRSRSADGQRTSRTVRVEPGD